MKLPSIRGSWRRLKLRKTIADQRNNPGCEHRKSEIPGHGSCPPEFAGTTAVTGKGASNRIERLENSHALSISLAEDGHRVALGGLRQAIFKILKSLDDANRTIPCYLGWALHSYNDYSQQVQEARLTRADRSLTGPRKSQPRPRK